MNAIIVISNKKYQKYLDFMARQLSLQQIDAYAITKPDVNVPDRFIKIDPSDFIVNAGLGKTYKPNDNLTDAFLKLYIPYVKCLYKYDKVLYVDLDVQLVDGWMDIFNFNGQKFITACQDIGINRFSNLNVLKFYKNRSFSYANTGVMLFDMKKRQEFPSIDIIRQLINFASDNNFLYADQDVLNLLDIIDCSLPLKFNCFRWLAARVNDVKIIYYTAEVGVKKLFDKFISEQG